MNTTEAKRIPLVLILERIGFSPIKITKGEATYSSPLRTEKTPSFQVNTAKNVWYDFGEGMGGNAVDFVCAYLASRGEANTLHDAVRWLNNIAGSKWVNIEKPRPTLVKREASLKIKKTSAIRHKALIGYLAKRGIPLNVASPYIVQVEVYNKVSTKSFFALGMLNEDEGYELRNPFFKGSAGAKTISFIRGMEPKPNDINIFEGMFDYLSLLTGKNIDQLPGDTIVLHSLCCLKQAIPYIKNYGYSKAYTWLDNDKAGTQATRILAEFFQTEELLKHKPMNAEYYCHKDVSAWHMHKLKL